MAEPKEQMRRSAYPPVMVRSPDEGAIQSDNLFIPAGQLGLQLEYRFFLPTAKLSQKYHSNFLQSVRAGQAGILHSSLLIFYIRRSAPRGNGP